MPSKIFKKLTSKLSELLDELVAADNKYQATPGYIDTIPRLQAMERVIDQWRLIRKLTKEHL